MQNAAHDLGAGVGELIVDDEGISVAGHPDRRLSYDMIYHPARNGLHPPGRW